MTEATGNHGTSSPAVGELGDLVRELQQLRRGHGLHTPNVMARVGPILRGVCGIFADQPGGDQRQLLAGRIGELVLELPEDLQLAVQAAYGLLPASQSRFLRERMIWYGLKIGRDPRTAMRRVESGLTLLSELMLSKSSGQVNLDENRWAPDGSFISQFRATFLMRSDTVELLETRTVNCVQDGLRELPVSWSVPADAPAKPDDMRVEMLYGGELLKDERASTPTYWTGVIVLPRELLRGDQHEYQVKVTSLPRGYLRPYYVLTPHCRTDEFELRAKFDLSDAPAAIWLLDGVPFQLVEENQPMGTVLALDTVGEVRNRFQNLRPGFSYGLRWRYESAAIDLWQAESAIPVQAEPTGRD